MVVYLDWQCRHTSTSVYRQHTTSNRGIADMHTTMIHMECLVSPRHYTGLDQSVKFGEGGCDLLCGRNYLTDVSVKYTNC